MAKINTKIKYPTVETHEGAKVNQTTYENQLRRSVMSCLLWENEFYEDDIIISKRIEELCTKVSDETISKFAIEAREKQKLRHIPLFLVRQMARQSSKLTADTLYKVIQRADELTEFLAIYWKDGKTPISAQVKKGLASAFTKFNRYQLGKYNRDGIVKLRDVLFLTHAKPLNDEQAKDWKDLVDGTLESPDTWEVNLSTGKDKKETFERLINENKLGGMAVLRNLRNMIQSGVSDTLIKQSIQQMNTDKILPFRFISASKYAPKFEEVLEHKMLESVKNNDKLLGKTVFIVDISGSMNATLSSKSELSRYDVACSLAILIRECCEEVVIYATAGNDSTRVHATDIVPNRRGFALRDAIRTMNSSLGGGGIFTHQLIKYIESKESDIDRVIIITDEQDCDIKTRPDTAPLLGKTNYIINVASAKNGVGYGKWVHIDGWSESVIDYIIEVEKLNN